MIKMMTMKVASSPGKVLVVGGYAITHKGSLNPDPHQALALSSNARVISKATLIASTSPSTSTTSSRVTIKVIPSQFGSNSETTSTLIVSSNACVKLNRSSTNVAVVAAAVALAYCFGDAPPSQIKQLIEVNVSITAHVDFYANSNAHHNAQSLQLRSAIEPRSKTDSYSIINPQATPQSIAKTGLGSSAAVATSIVASILHSYDSLFPNSNTIPNSTLPFQQLVCRLTTIAHYIAQGKLGSGFDVSVASHGSQIFLPNENLQAFVSSLQNVIHIQDPSSSTIPSIDGKKLRHLVLENNNANVPVFQNNFIPLTNRLPRRMRLVLFDVNVGSSTPQMVREFSSFLKYTDPPTSSPNNIEDETQSLDINTLTKARSSWALILTSNERVVSNYIKLIEFSNNQSTAYDHVVDHIMNCMACSPRSTTLCSAFQKTNNEAETKIWTTFRELTEALDNIRTSFRTLSDISKCPIIPNEIDGLLSFAVENSRNLLAVGVPGAGGFDAFFGIFLVNDNEIIVNDINETLPIGSFQQQILDLTTGFNSLIQNDKKHLTFKHVHSVIPLRSTFLDECSDQQDRGLMLDVPLLE